MVGLEDENLSGVKGSNFRRSKYEIETIVCKIVQEICG
jgi:hypothetical protein